MCRYYTTGYDRLVELETEHHEAVEGLRDLRPDLARRLLIAINFTLAELRESVAQAIRDLDFARPVNEPAIELDTAFLPYAREAVPTIDDMLQPDHLSRVFGAELSVRTCAEFDLVNLVALERVTLDDLRR